MKGSVPLVIVERIYDNIVAASLAKPVGPFLLRLPTQDFALAQGNIVNEQWTWGWAHGERPHAQERLLRVREYDTDMLPTPPPLAPATGLVNADTRSWANLRGDKLA